MKQHELDPVSLFFGLVFGFVSGAYVLTHTTDVHLQWLVLIPAGLIALGIAVLVATVRKMREPGQSEHL